MRINTKLLSIKMEFNNNYRVPYMFKMLEYINSLRKLRYNYQQRHNNMIILRIK